MSDFGGQIHIRELKYAKKCLSDASQLQADFLHFWAMVLTKFSSKSTLYKE